jgi:hypothetical protein
MLFEVARWGYMYSIIAVPAFSNARGLYQGTTHASETCLWQQGSMLGSDQLCKKAQWFCDSIGLVCYQTRSLIRDAPSVDSTGPKTAVHDRKLRYHSHFHVNIAQQHAMWLIDRVQGRDFWHSSDTVDGKCKCPNTSGGIMFASPSTVSRTSRLESRKPQAALNRRYSCCPTANN